MKTVKPMEAKETVIESRTIIIRDELPKAKLSLKEIREDDKGGKKDLLEADDVEEEEEGEEKKDDGSIAAVGDVNNEGNTYDGGANPNEGGDEALANNENGLTENGNNDGSKRKHRKTKKEKIAEKEKQLQAQKDKEASEHPTEEEPERQKLKVKFLQIARQETKMIYLMQKNKLACADEVRNVHLPAHRAKKIENFQEDVDELVYNGFYGGSNPHLRMKLPDNYPVNARPYNLEAIAAAKGKELMLAAQKKKTKTESGIDVKLVNKKGRQEFALELVEYMLKQNDRHEQYVDDWRGAKRRAVRTKTSNTRRGTHKAFSNTS